MQKTSDFTLLPCSIARFVDCNGIYDFSSSYRRISALMSKDVGHCISFPLAFVGMLA